MKRIRIAVMLLLMGIGTCFAQEQPPAKVVVSPVTEREVAGNQSFIGLIAYDRVGHVSSEVSGLVESIKVREGDKVSAGDVLLQLDTEMLDVDISLNKTRIAQSELRIEQARKDLDRLKTLYDAEGVSERDYEQSYYTYENLVKEKQATQDALEKLLLQRRKSVVKAPFGGVILEKNIDKGDWVQQGRSLVTIGSSNDLYVRVPVAETLLRYLGENEKVPVVINAFEKELTGTVADFDPTADPKTKNVFLKVHIPPQEKVAENMSATVYIPTSRAKKLAIIPRDALIKFGGKDFVYTVKEGKASILPVNIVTYQGIYVAADNPYFTAGMPVVVEGNERLQPDQAVEVVGEK